MIHPLFIEIEKFTQWAQLQFENPRNNIASEWEIYYENWEDIYKNFENFLNTTDPERWTDEEKQQLLYIIARDNEAENLAEILSANETALIVLTNESIFSGHRDAKWQLAIQLHNLRDRKLALSLLEKLVNDDDEYVNRRALMELAELQSPKVEYYCELFWHRNKYGAMEEYQKIAVLLSLKTVNSKLLDKYIELAKQDGRKFLLENVLKLENC